MCTNLRRIRNPKKDFSPLNDKQFLTVPCGHCPECRLQSQLSWSVRLYYEFKNSISCHGKVFYYTLTYNDAHLPRLHGIPVFSKKDCQKFMKRLRKNLSKSGYLQDIKFFLTSEYGHEHYRPHYHILVFTYGDISNYVFHRCLRRAWSVRNKWSEPIGFVAPGKFGAVVNSFKPLKYVCKYITKDMSFMDMSEMLTKRLQLDFPKDDLETPEDYRNRIRSLFDEYTPFHLQSQHLGECIIQYLDSVQKELGKILIPSSKKGNKFDNVPLPLYILRKIFYNDYCPIDSKHNVQTLNSKGELIDHTIGDVRYMLNEEGIYQKLATLESKIDATAHRFDNYKSLQDTPELTKFLGFSFEDSQKRISLLLDGRDFIDLAIYDLVYRDRYDFGFVDYKSDFHDFIVPNESEFGPGTHSLYNLNPAFRGFDEILSIIQKYKVYCTYIDYNQRVDDWNIRQRLQHECDPVNYPRLHLMENLSLDHFIYS